MNPERRIHARRILYSPEYLDMGADNGGVVLNLSEGGLAFQALHRVLPEEEIPVSFSLGTAYRIDVKARVAWVNKDGKIGGAIFGKLSKDSRSLIREWLAKQETDHELEPEDAALNAKVAGTESTLVGDVMPTAVGAPAIAVTEQAANGTPEASPESSARAIEERVVPNDLVRQPNGVNSADIAAQPPLANGIPTLATPASNMRTSGVAKPLDRPSVQDSPKNEPFRTVYEKSRPTVTARETATMPLFQRGLGLTPRATEQKRERHEGASFSAVPSISMWSRGDAPLSPTNQENAAPAFPLRNAENIFARSPHTEALKDRGGSGKLFIIAIVIAAAALAAFYLRTHRQQVGIAVSHIGEQIAGTPAANSGPPANAAPASPASATANAPGSDDSLKKSHADTPAQAPSLSTSKQGTNPSSASSVSPPSNNPAAPPSDAKVAKAVDQTPPPISSQARPIAPRNANPGAVSGASLLAGQSEYQRAEQYLNGKGVTQDYAQAAQWFWRSLETGYTDAAVPLANLYLEGNGVSRSCTQARVLLQAAAQKNNAQAIQKLAQIPDNCP